MNGNFYELMNKKQSYDLIRAGGHLKRELGSEGAAEGSRLEGAGAGRQYTTCPPPHLVRTDRHGYVVTRSFCIKGLTSGKNMIYSGFNSTCVILYPTSNSDTKLTFHSNDNESNYIFRHSLHSLHRKAVYKILMKQNKLIKSCQLSNDCHNLFQIQ